MISDCISKIDMTILLLSKIAKDYLHMSLRHLLRLLIVGLESALRAFSYTDDTRTLAYIDTLALHLLSCSCIYCASLSRKLLIITPHERDGDVPGGAT